MSKEYAEAGPKIPQPYPGAVTDCYAQAQWHNYSTVVIEGYEIEGTGGRILKRSDSRVVCTKCGSIVFPSKVKT